MQYTHIVFDIDGTLIDSEYAGLKGFQELLYDVTGRLYTAKELAFSYGITAEDALRQLNVADIDGALSVYGEYTRKYLSTLKLYPDIPRVLRTLKDRGCSLGIVTSRTEKEFREEALPLLEPLLPLFDVVVLASMTQRHKPHPEPLLKYLELAGATAEETLFIGDTDGDSGCARGAGVDFALATWGSHGEIPAKYFPKTPEELLHLI